MHGRPWVSLAATLVLACAAPWTGCGGSSSSLGSGGGDASTSSSSSGGGSSGGPTDASSGSSSGASSSSGSGSTGSSGGSSDAGGTCPAVACPGSQVCCADLTTDTPACSTSCAADDTIACVGPSDCGGSTPDCCATDVLDGMDAGESFPHCYTESLTTKCVAKCVSNIQISCKATETLHVCQATADCTDDTANPNCCVVAGYHVCVSNVLKGLGGLTCL